MTSAVPRVNARGSVSSPKQLVQRVTRGVHLALFRRSLPDKVSLYLHSTASRQAQARFDELLGFLTYQGYSFAGPGDFLTARGKTAFVSFDDNYLSWLSAVAILNRRRCRATFYVNSLPFCDRVDAAQMRAYLDRLGAEEDATLSTAQLLEIADAGHTVGSHTHSHPVLTGLPPDQAHDEIRIGKAELESLLQRPVLHFSYPYGMRRHFNEPLRRFCRSIGFVSIANGIPGMQYASSSLENLHRSVWFLEQPLAFNLDNLCIDGRVFHAATGRSAIGGGR
jgi:peptidoglycan/xylan/chitin deacetylase (PgdA/CDA1 family)